MKSLSIKSHGELIILLTAITGFFPIQTFAQTYKAEKGKAQFISNSTLEDFTGKSDYLVGQVNLADSTVSFYLDLSTLHTGVKLRDEHMQEEYLETNKYPFAQFSGKLVSSFDPAAEDTQQVKVRGDFKIHGITHHIQVTGEMATGNHLYVQAHWQLKLSDYDIKIPKVLFMKVSNMQKISITASMDEINSKH